MRLSFPWGARLGEELLVRGRLHVQLCGEAARRLLPAVRAGPRFSAPSPTLTVRLFGSHHPSGCRVAPHGAFNSFEPNCCKLV